MISIGVIIRGKYGLRLIENLKKHSDFNVLSSRMPENLPDFIENPCDFLEELDLDRRVFSSDLIIAYTLHPDLTPEIARLAGKNGARAVIIAGGMSGAGGLSELETISKQYNIHIEVHEICCEINRCDNNIINEFTSFFGNPEFSVTTKNGMITGVEVVRGAPCGSTWHAAEKLVGTTTEDAPAKAGLLVQQYPCRALRGIRGGIHKAADLHKNALERALKEK